MESVLVSLLGSNPTLSTVALATLAIVIVSLVTGMLTPKWITKSLLDARDQRVVQANIRAEDYKGLYETTNRALQASQHQVTELLVAAEATRKIAEAIPVVINSTGRTA